MAMELAAGQAVDGQALDFEPIDPAADLSPAEVDRHLKRLYNELGFARLRLRDARYAEIRAKRAWEERRVELLLSGACPEISRSNNVSRDDRDDWLTGQAPDLWWAYQGAKVVRETSEDFGRMLREQVKCIQSIGANARQAYDLAGR